MGLPESLDGFLGFYEQRRVRIETRLRQLLGAEPAEAE